ncbi:hypothetical protein AGMMS50293_25510 [Spirochaetia bacterium]|nr:hypothetical protein AGMMS50293_25510 [Spirochaetia bacterium]
MGDAKVIDTVLYFCYTKNMKTAISLSDKVYKEFEPISNAGLNLEGERIGRY